MKKDLYIFTVSLFCLSLASCGGCSKQNDTSWADGEDSEYYENPNNEPETSGDKAMEYPVEVEISSGVTLAEAGKEVYTDLLNLEDRYNIGGVKLCAEMSADRNGKWVSSFYEPTNVTFQPPSEIHLHKIVVTDSSSNIICRIVNGEISTTVGNVQRDVYRTNTTQPAFIVNITVNNRMADSIFVVIPIGQMLEVQAPDVQNIVVSKTYIIVLAPYQSKTFNVSAYCGAEKRRNPTYHSAKLTPFVLTAPAYAYNSQQSLWNFQKTKPVTDRYYTITFYAWRIGTRVGNDELSHKSPTGHAFVDIPEIGVVGYGGTVTDHAKYIRYADYKVSIKINKTSLRKAQDKYWEWKNNPPEYELAKYDCTTFVMDIADAAGIYYGPRWTIQFPAGLMRELRAYNR